MRLLRGLTVGLAARAERGARLRVGAGVVVTSYVDEAVGTMVEVAETGGHFIEVVLRPVATLQPGSDAALAAKLHERAHHLCFVANSVNFPVRCEPMFRSA